MKTVTVPKYVLDNALDALRLSANILESRKRETAADRQIEFSERLLKWVEAGQVGEPPRWTPNHSYEKLTNPVEQTKKTEYKCHGNCNGDPRECDKYGCKKPEVDQPEESKEIPIEVKNIAPWLGS